MPNTAKTLLALLAFSAGLLAATGCGGSEPATEAPPEVAPEPEPTFPRMACPEGSAYRESATPQGVEQICDVNGVKNGPFRRWYGPDLREVDGNYKMGAADGAWVWWYPDGTKKSKGSYRGKKQAGSWTWWHENGTKIEEGDFLVGRKEGTWTRWYEDGKKLEEGMYHNGVKSSAWQYYRADIENTQKRSEVWQAGVKKETKFYALDGKTVIADALPEDLAAPETAGQPVEEPDGDAPPEDGAEGSD